MTNYEKDQIIENAHDNTDAVRALFTVTDGDARDPYTYYASTSRTDAERYADDHSDWFNRLHVNTSPLSPDTARVRAIIQDLYAGAEVK